MGKQQFNKQKKRLNRGFPMIQSVPKFRENLRLLFFKQKKRLNRGYPMIQSVPKFQGESETTIF